MDFSRLLTLQKVKAGLDADGKLIALNHDVVSAWPTQRWGILDFLSPSVDKKGPLDAFTVNGADFFYSVPNHNVRAIKNEMAHNATLSGQLRSVAPGWTFKAVESMIDELAHVAAAIRRNTGSTCSTGKGANAGGAQRPRNTLPCRDGHGRLRQPGQLPKGEGYGRRLRVVAGAGNRKLSDRLRRACGGGADPRGLKVKQLTVATDVGTWVHPDDIRAQVEGAALWGFRSPCTRRRR